MSPEGSARHRAGALVDARQYRLARVEIGRALAEDPDDGAAFHVLALLEQREGRYDEALAALDRATALGVAPTSTLHTRMNTLYHARRFAEAVSAAEELLRHDPQQLQAHIMLAQMLGGEGRADYHRALAHAEHAVALAPEHDHAHYALGQVLSSTHGRRGARAALPHLQQAVQLRPDDAANLNALGVVDLTLGRSRRALRSFADALAVDPSLEPAAFNLPLAMLVLARRTGHVVSLLFVASAVVGVALAPRRRPPEPGAGWPAHVVAVVLALVVVGLVVTWLVRAVPPAVRPAASRAWRRDPVLVPLAASSALQVVCAVGMLAVPLPNGVQVPPLFLLGALVRIVANVVSRRRTLRYGRERTAERAELWRPARSAGDHRVP